LHERISAEPNGVMEYELQARFGMKRDALLGVLRSLEGKGFVKRTWTAHGNRYSIIKKTATPIKNCPFCGKGFRFLKTPRYCQYCKEELANEEPKTEVWTGPGMGDTKIK
jgi:hypothetical protein